MKRHDWREQTETGEKRLWRATKHGRRWAIYSRLQKSEDGFVEHSLDELDALRQLREVLFNKYQRQRVPWEDVVTIDGFIEEAGGAATETVIGDETGGG